MSQTLPRIKVCGVTLETDLANLVTAGVDTVGLNLVPSSPRVVDGARRRSLAVRARELGLLCVAVTMNSTATELQELIDEQLFDFIQLHGSETPALLDSLHVGTHAPGIIKAVSWSGRREEAELASEWARTSRATAEGPKLQLRAFLVDAYAPGQGGGTGRVARWDLLFPRPESLEAVPLILAGGLTPSNVADGIVATHPAGVDTASGVEHVPGIKLAELVSDFASNASNAFKAIQTRRASK